MAAVFGRKLDMLLRQNDAREQVRLRQGDKVV
jgi:hypothetical protein